MVVQQSFSMTEQILKIITKHNDDINNNNKSVIDLRKTLIAIDSDRRINILLEKITNLEEDEERNKKKILDLYLEREIELGKMKVIILIKKLNQSFSQL